MAARPGLRAVTRDGDLVGAGWVDGGSDRKPSTLEIAGRIEQACSDLAAAETQVAELAAALAGATAEQSDRRDTAEQALAALNESDAAISAIYEQLGWLGQEPGPLRGSGADWCPSATNSKPGGPRRSRISVNRDQAAGRSETQAVVEASPGERQEIQAAAEAARAVEVEARLVVRTAEERANSVRGRAGFTASGRRCGTRGAGSRPAGAGGPPARRGGGGAVSEAGRRVAERLAGVVSAASRERDRLAGSADSGPAH